MMAACPSLCEIHAAQHHVVVLSLAFALICSVALVVRLRSLHPILSTGVKQGSLYVSAHHLDCLVPPFART